jgi:hypothetical protein
VQSIRRYFLKGYEMKKLLLIALVALSGCSMIPSKWDDNQSKAAVDLQLMARHFNCEGDQKTQLNLISAQVEWFDLYSKSKGTADMEQLNDVFAKTVKEYQDRLAKGPVSPMYCDLKKKIMTQQADIIAHAVLYRF